MVSTSSIGSFRGRRLLWSTLAFLSILLWAATGPVKAQQLPGASNQFILRAPAARIQSIAARHGLTVIRQLDGQDVFLVSRSVLPLSPLTGLNSAGDNGLLDGISEVQSDSYSFTPETILNRYLADAFTSIGATL